MNKKIIAAAIAAVVAAPAVSAADTTVYGKAHVFVAKNDMGSTDNYTAESTNSRLGVKGSEDLGNGLKAIFKYETTVNITDGSSAGGTFGSARNAYVGLSGDFGTFLVGRHDTPMKVAFYASGTDYLDGSIVDMNTNGFYERRLDNAIAYISPSFSGFTVAAAIVPGEKSGTATTTKSAGLNAAKTAVVVNTTTNANTADSLNDAYSLGVIYAGGGLKASVGYEVATSDYLGKANDDKTWQAGASYTFGDFVVGGNFQKTSDMGGAAGVDMTIWALSAKANFGNNYVIAEYGNNDTDLKKDVDTLGLAVGHKFSKRTQVYAAYENVDDSNAGSSKDGDRFALGMIHTF
jgi:predicted porin